MSAKILAEYQEQLQAAAAHISPPVALTFKSMFGGMCAYWGELVFASLSDVGLALKLAQSDQEELLELPGTQRLRYDPQSPPSKQYIIVPLNLRKDPKALSGWLERSLVYVRDHHRPKKKKAKDGDAAKKETPLKE